MERIARTLSMVRDAPKPAPANIHDQFVDRRNKLNQHDTKMHTPYPPAQQTIYGMQGALLRLPGNIVSPLRWRGPDLMQITTKSAERVMDLLGEAGGFETLFTRTDPSPWTGVELKDGQSVEEAIDLVDRLNHHVLPGLLASLRSVCESSALREPTTMADTFQLLNLFKQAEQLLGMYEPQIFAEADHLLAQILPCHVNGIRGVWLRATNSDYKTAYKRATQLRKGLKAARTTVVAELSKALQTQQQWQQLSESAARPTAVLGIQEFEHKHRTAQADLRKLDVVCKSSLHGLRLIEIATRVSALSCDSTTPYRIRRLYEIELELYSLGLQRLVDEVRFSCRPANQWCALFQHVWLNSSLMRQRFKTRASGAS
jgi:hypothetical protein